MLGYLLASVTGNVLFEYLSSCGYVGVCVNICAWEMLYLSICDDFEYLWAFVIGTDVIESLNICDYVCLEHVVFEYWSVCGYVCKCVTTL